MTSEHGHGGSLGKRGLPSGSQKIGVCEVEGVLFKGVCEVEGVLFKGEAEEVHGCFPSFSFLPPKSHHSTSSPLSTL